MVLAWILAAPTLLDKLPAWLALPLGGGVSAAVGYWAVSGAPSLPRMLLALLILGAAVVLGLGAPRPVSDERPGEAPGAPPDGDLFV